MQVSNVDYLNTFITSLSNDNAIETQFPSYRRASEPVDDGEHDSDIDSARGDRGSDDMNFGRSRQKGEYLTSLTHTPANTKEVGLYAGIARFFPGLVCTFSLSLTCRAWLVRERCPTSLCVNGRRLRTVSASCGCTI